MFLFMIEDNAGMHMHADLQSVGAILFFSFYRRIFSRCIRYETRLDYVDIIGDVFTCAHFEDSSGAEMLNH